MRMRSNSHWQEKHSPFSASGSVASATLANDGAATQPLFATGVR